VTDLTEGAGSILVLAPTGRDAELACRFLRAAGMDAHPCTDMADLVSRVGQGCAALVLAEESLGKSSVQMLTTLLASQPSWSEIPICIITSGGEARAETLRRLAWFAPTGNVTVLERPFRPGTLVNTMQVAARSRQRQYQLRDLLAERTALAHRFRLMADTMPHKVFTATLQGNAEYYNQEWLEYTALSLPAMISTGWLSFIHPDDLPETDARWRSSTSSGHPFEMEHRIRCHDGTYRWHLSRARAVHDEAGRVFMFIGSNTDVDEQKTAAAKLEKLVAERTASLMETNQQLEAFCYTISHDLRSPLRAQRSFSMALLEEFGEVIGPTGREYALRINLAAERLEQLVADLLSYSRVSRADLPLTPVDLRAAVALIEEEMRFDIERTGAMLHVEPFLFHVQAHGPTLALVLRNLISNALKFVKPNALPEIRITAERRGDCIRLTIADNGIGIAPEHHPKIFGLFNRLHKVGEYPGTGVGLAIVEKAVERLQGQTGVDSKLEQGSRFWLQLKEAVPPSQTF
jgi:PAS domain S-box-containing protein